MFAIIHKVLEVEPGVASILVRFRQERGGAAASRGTREPNQNVSEAYGHLFNNKAIKLLSDAFVDTNSE